VMFSLHGKDLFEQPLVNCLISFLSLLLTMKNLFSIFIISFIAISVVAQTTVVDSFMYEGVWRNYRIFLPSGFNASLQYPLVFNFHGLTSNAQQQELYTEFNNVADTAGVVVCHPNGINNSWNLAPGFPNDIGFVDTMITAFHNQYNINLNRVYATGLSNGGFLSNLLACQLANRFAAIAPVAGTLGITQPLTCNPPRHVPVLYIHGTADPVVDYNGGPSFCSALALTNLWSASNLCQSQDTFALPNISTTDGCSVERITWHDCDSNKQVVHYRILGGGHTWPGATFPIGVTNQDFNASATIWEFFNQFQLNTGINNYVEYNIEIYPTLFYSNLFVRLPFSSPSQLKIYSIDGRLVFSSVYVSDFIIPETKNLSQGIYFLKIEFENTLRTFRVEKIN
jgi:polyhydroxybutyrate depolymerase